MSDSNDKMVLRTVYLPREIDEQLRLIAFRQGKTKNDLIRNVVKSAIESGVLSATPKTKTQTVAAAKPKSRTAVKPKKSAAAKVA